MQKRKKKKKERQKYKKKEGGKCSWLHWGNHFPHTFVFIELFFSAENWNEKTSWKKICVKYFQSNSNNKNINWKCNLKVLNIFQLSLWNANFQQIVNNIFNMIWYLVFELANHHSAFFSLSLSAHREILELHKRREERILLARTFFALLPHIKNNRNDVKWKTFLTSVCVCVCVCVQSKLKNHRRWYTLAHTHTVIFPSHSLSILDKNCSASKVSQKSTQRKFCRKRWKAESLSIISSSTSTVCRVHSQFYRLVCVEQSSSSVLVLSRVRCLCV